VKTLDYALDVPSPLPGTWHLSAGSGSGRRHQIYPVGIFTLSPIAES